MVRLIQGWKPKFGTKEHPHMKFAYFAFVLSSAFRFSRFEIVFFIVVPVSTDCFDRPGSNIEGQQTTPANREKRLFFGIKSIFSISAILSICFVFANFSQTTTGNTPRK